MVSRLRAGLVLAVMSPNPTVENTVTVKYMAPVVFRGSVKLPGLCVHWGLSEVAFQECGDPGLPEGRVGDQPTGVRRAGDGEDVHGVR